MVGDMGHMGGLINKPKMLQNGVQHASGTFLSKNKGITYMWITGSCFHSRTREEEGGFFLLLLLLESVFFF